MIARNPIIRDPVVMVNNAGGSNRVAINTSRVIAGQDVASQIAIEEMAGGNETEMISSQTEGEIVSWEASVERQADTGDESGARRQGSPAAIIAALAPANPRRTPDAVGSPAPAETCVLKPATIMKRRPTP
jgi:hypothetical protein